MVAWGGWGYSYGCHGCYGCYGCYGGCYGSGYYSMPMVVPPVMPMMPGKPPEGVEKARRDAESMVPARASKLHRRAAGAMPKLYIDDQPIKMETTSRQFNTPELQPGQTFYYMVRVEVMKDNVPQTVSRRVLVRAGEEVTADFKDMAAPTAAVSTAKK